jgi:hypothetical protein
MHKVEESEEIDQLHEWSTSQLTCQRHLEHKPAESMITYFYMKSAKFCFQANNALKGASVSKDINRGDPKIKLEAAAMTMVTT